MQYALALSKPQADYYKAEDPEAGIVYALTLVNILQRQIRLDNRRVTHWSAQPQANGELRIVADVVAPAEDKI